MALLHHLKQLFIGLALITAIVGCHRSSKPKPPPPSVSVATVDQYDVPIYVDAIGQAITPQEVQVRPQVQGKLLAAFVEQGAIVKAGDVLYLIDSRPYQAILDQASAQLVHDLALFEIANKTVERYKKVIEDDYISVLTYEQYESNAQAAKAQVDADIAAVAAAQLNVDFCRVVAPVSGKISTFNVYVGNILTAYDANYITVIRPFNPIDILFSLSQSQFESIRVEQGNAGEWPFVASIPEKPAVEFSGKTYFIDNQINQNTGTILLKGRCSNKDRDVWPGEFMKVKVLKKMAKQALVVPPGAVLIGKDGPYVYTLDSEDKASAQQVTVLTRTNAYIAVESKDLKKGDRVITDGQINVAPGLVVQTTANNKASDTRNQEIKS